MVTDPQTHPQTHTIVSEMTYTVSSGTLNPCIPYDTKHTQTNKLTDRTDYNTLHR